MTDTLADAAADSRAAILSSGSASSGPASSGPASSGPTSSGSPSSGSRPSHRKLDAEATTGPGRLAVRPHRVPIADSVRVTGPTSRRMPRPRPERLRRRPVRIARSARPTSGPAHARRFTLPPGWPLKALLVLFPLWWVLGLTTFIFPILALPMLIQLRRQGRVRVPPFFWAWLLYAVWDLLSLVMFTQSPPGTHDSGSIFSRLTSVSLGEVMFVSVTITLLYVGNLPTEQVSQRDIGRWMGYFFFTVLAGGFLGLAAPHLQFRSAIEYVLPHSLRANPYVASMVHPVAAQVQNLIGDEGGRPAAPFGYTNSWGYAISVLLVWFVMAWVVPATGRRRLLYTGIAAASVIPIILSLNRGLWIGVIVTVVWIAFRQLIQGKVGLLIALFAALAVATALFFVTPAHTIVEKRLANGKSNSIRTFVAEQSLNGLEHSPIIGYGGTRHTDGSATSIAVGKSADCAHCGDVATGSTGTFWAIMFNQGAGGLLLYFGFFAASLVVYWRQRSHLDEAALAVVVLVFIYMLFYDASPMAPTLTMIGIGLLWRSREAATRARGRTVPA